MAAAIRDRFANVATIETVQSAANTLTFASLATNMGFLGRRDQALAMLIDEIQYAPGAGSIALVSGQGEFIVLALTDSDVPNSTSDLSLLTDRRILDHVKMEARHSGTPASAEMITTPWRHQFFPPLITAARTLFLGISTTGLAAAITSQVKILFRVETLTGAELVELSEVFRLTG